MSQCFHFQVGNIYIWPITRIFKDEISTSSEHLIGGTNYELVVTADKIKCQNSYLHGSFIHGVCLKLNRDVVKFHNKNVSYCCVGERAHTAAAQDQ